jgi:hypothetical protein
MKTLTRPSEPIANESVYRCANPSHWRLASAFERMRFHDHRWQNPTDIVPEHDYCARACRTTHALSVRGRPAFCPLGDAAGDDHYWVALPDGAFRRSI